MSWLQTLKIRQSGFDAVNAQMKMKDFTSLRLTKRIWCTNKYGEIRSCKSFAFQRFQCTCRESEPHTNPQERFIKVYGAQYEIQICKPMNKKTDSWWTQIDITNVIDFSKARFEPANLWVKTLGSWCSQIDINCMIDFWKLESRGSELHTFLLQHTCIESRQNLARLGETWTHTPSKPPDSCMKWRQCQTLESNTHTFQISHMLTESHKTF